MRFVIYLFLLTFTSVYTQAPTIVPRSEPFYSLKLCKKIAKRNNEFFKEMKPDYHYKFDCIAKPLVEKT